jgi:hypothetical protein
MTTRPDGSVECDRCGADVGNGGVNFAAVISVLSDTGGRVLNLHLCTFTGRLEGVDGRKSPEAQRCVSRVLTKAALAHYTANVGEPGEPLTPYRYTPEEA